MIPRRYWLSVLLFIGAAYFIARSGTPDRPMWPEWLQDAPVPVICLEPSAQSCRVLVAFWPIADHQWVSPVLPKGAPRLFFYRTPLQCRPIYGPHAVGSDIQTWYCPQGPAPKWQPFPLQELRPGTRWYGWGRDDRGWVRVSVRIAAWQWYRRQWWILIRPDASVLLPGSPILDVRSHRVLGLAMAPDMPGEDWWVWPLTESPVIGPMDD